MQGKFDRSNFEKWLFNLLLGSNFLQETSFDIQRLLLFNHVMPKKPVFIAGMPRSGTTLLLNLLFDTNQFQSIRYIDLPFPLMPILSRIISKFSEPMEVIQERAHGDGVLVSRSSPEAFEEVFWRVIDQNQSEADIISGLCSLVFLYSSKSNLAQRYLSKNNNSISRINLIAKVCQLLDGILLVPIREPQLVAESSLKIHGRILKIQKEDPFAIDYMRNIGHQEFGLEIQWRSVNGRVFNPSFPANDVNCWLEYWIHLHEQFLTAFPKEVVLFSHRQLCESPNEFLPKIWHLCSIDNDKTTSRSKIHREGASKLDSKFYSPKLLNDAVSLYNALVNSITNHEFWK